MDIVLSLGGSIIVPESVDTGFLKKFKQMVLDFISKGNRIVLVCGGGNTCRVYNKAAKEVNPEVKQEDLDWIGIKATKINAELVRAIFGDIAYEKVIDNPNDKIKTDKKIIIGSGWVPGFSSDMDAVLLAKNLGMDAVVNLSNIAYVYDKDPSKYPDAKPLENITFKQMQEIVGEKWIPGSNLPFDPVATKEAASLGIKVIIMKGTDIKNLKNLLEEKEYKGTTISY